MVNFISISGKANSGKNTIAELIFKRLGLNKNSQYVIPKCQILAFADPIKEMAMIMFPYVKREFFYGSSKLRNYIIPGAFKNGTPLTVRQLLIDIGSGLGKQYNPNIWIENLDRMLNAQSINTSVIVPDVRFREEFDYLKSKNFTQIRILRDDIAKSQDLSEISQEEIKDDEFDYVIYNNGTLEDLKDKITDIMNDIINQ